MNDERSSNDLSILFLSSEVQRLRKALADLKEGITYNATDTVWYSGIETACDRIDAILISGQGVTAHEPSAWQPIVTAPKDGRRFLAIGLGPMFICSWGEGANIWQDASGQWRDPRYWRELPEGPCSAVTKESSL